MFCLIGFALPTQAKGQPDTCRQLEELVVSAERSLERMALGEAHATAEALDVNACPALAGRLAKIKVALAQAERKVRQDVSLAILACDRDRVTAARQSLIATGMEIEPQTSAAIAAVMHTVAKLDSLLETATTQVAEGDFDSAEATLGSAKETLAEASKVSECANLRQDVDDLGERLAEQRIKAAQADAVASSCDLAAISDLVEVLRSRKALSAAERALTDRLAKIETHLKRVQLARKLAQRKQDIGDLPAAAGLLDRAGDMIAQAPAADGCEQERARITREAAALREVVEASAAANNALASCDLASLRQAKSALMRTPHPQFDPLSNDIETATRLALALMAANRSLEQGQYERAGEVLDRLIADLGAADGRICPHAIERARQMQARLSTGARLLAAFDEARKSCNAAQIEEARQTPLPDDQAIRDKAGELAGLAAAITRHTETVANVVAALEAAADADAAAAALSPLEEDLPALPETPACAAVRESAADLKRKAHEIIAAARDTEEMLRSDCRRMDLKKIEQNLAPFGRYRAAERLIDAVRTLSAIKKRLGPDLEPAIYERNFDLLIVHFDWAITKAETIPADFCTDKSQSVKEQLADLRAKVAEARAIVEQVSQIGNSCDRDEIAAAVQGLKKATRVYFFPPDYFDGELKQLNAYQSSCREKEWRQQIEAANARCRAQLGVYGEAVERSGSFSCDCVTPYRLDPSRTSCLKPRSMVEREANASCQSNYGNMAYAVDIQDDGRHNCRCGNGYIALKGTKGCVKPTGRQLEKVTGDLCREAYGKLSISVEVKSVDDYKCQCRSGTRWNSAGTECYRPTRQELRNEAWASCRKAYGSRLINVVVNKDGSTSCEYRKTRQELHQESLAACRRQYGSRVKGVRLNKKGTRYWCTF